MIFDHRMVDRYKRRSADAVFNQVGRLSNCLGFVDAIALQICRPVKHAKQAYSACKKMHCPKFQMVTLANGMIVSLFGPIEGIRGDCHLFRESGISEELARHPDYVLFGDVGESLTNWQSTPNAGSTQSNDEESFNQDMSRARGDANWVFGWVVRYWKFFKRVSNMKVFETPVGMLFVVTAFLTNCLSCVRRCNQATENFKCTLPTLEIYLADLLAPSGVTVDENAYISDDEFYITVDNDSDISMDDSSAIDSESESGDDSMAASPSSSDERGTE